MNIKNLSCALTLSFAAAGSYAAPLAYPGIGSENPHGYSFTAANSGSIVAYFVDAEAGYTSTLSLFVNGVEVGSSVLNNQTSSYGDSISFDNINAGDELILRLNVLNTSNQWYSDTSLNSDGAHHIYSYNYNGDSILPAGTYIGFEDLINGGDWDYNDATFLLTNTSVTSVPVPAAAWLFGSGLLGLAGIARRRLA